MVAFNFKERFVPLILDGTKTSTIRRSLRNAHNGDCLQLYTGQRTKKCRKIGDAVLSRVETLKVSEHGLYIKPQLFGKFRRMSQAASDKTAKEDGFSSYDDMWQWFKETHGCGFIGYRYIWKDFKPC